MQQDSAPPTIGYLLSDLSRLFGRVFDRRAAHLRLTRVQWRALKRIHEHAGLSQVELADALDLDPIAVGRVVDRLEKAGFVERRADPADRRRWRLRPLAQADQVMGEVSEVANQMRVEALAGLSEAEVDVLLCALLQVRDNLVGMDQAGRAPASPERDRNP